MSTSGSLPFEFSFSGRGNASRRREPDAPLRILLCADLAGDSAGGRSQPLAQRKPVKVDIDTLPKVFGRFAPRALLSVGGASNPVDFQSLDDFHPDSLMRRLPLFGALRSLRADLADPKKFEQAAQALGAGSPAAGGGAPVAAPAPSPAADAAGDIERLLGRKPQSPPTPGAADSVVQGIIKGIIDPYIVAAPNARQSALIESVDGAIAQMLRQVLRDPGLRTLEATWRNVSRLVSEVGGEDNIELWLLDGRKSEWLADLRANAQALGDSALGRLLIAGREAHTEPWSILALDPMLDAGAGDLALLAALGSLAAAGGAALLAGIDGTLLGCVDSTALGNPAAWQTPAPATLAYWQALRQQPAAASIGLAVGRLMLRQPYGAKSDPIDSFRFEEITDPQDASQFLWGSPAPQLALLAALAYRSDVWEMDLDSQREIDDLPAFSYRDRDGDAQLRTSAEAPMSEQAAARWTAAGVMPLMSRRDRHSVSLMRWQSMADPARGLSGPWR